MSTSVAGTSTLEGSCAGLLLGVPGVDHPGIGLEVGHLSDALVGAVPGLVGRASLHEVDEVAREAGVLIEVAAPVPSVVAGAAEVRARPQNAVDVAHAGGDDVNDAVILADHNKRGGKVFRKNAMADICDDYDATADLLGLNEKARAAGVTAIIGLGAIPGMIRAWGM